MKTGKSKYLILAVILLQFIPYLFSETTQKKITIAVSEFEARQVSANDAVTVSDFLRNALVNMQLFDVVGRNNMTQVLEEQKFQLSGCTDEECIVKMGKVLNVEKIVFGNLTKFGDGFFIVASIVNVESGKIEISEKVKSASYDDIPNVIDNLALTIAGKLLGNKLSEPEETKSITAELDPLHDASKDFSPTEHYNCFGIGLNYTGMSLKYFSRVMVYELKSSYEETATALGPRVYVNFNPNSNAVVYIGAEYSVVSGKTDIQKFTGTFSGAFLGMELFISKKTSVFLDIGPYNINLISEFDRVKTNSSYLIGNLGFNIYF